MKSRLRILPRALALFALSGMLFTAGCGSGGGTRIRYVNALVGVRSVDFVVDSTTAQAGVTYGSNAAYQSISSGSRKIEVRNAGTTTDLINTTVSVSGDTTFIAETVAGVDQGAPYTDDNSAPPSGDIKLRFINASQSSGSVDIYVVKTGTPISGLSPTVPNLTQPQSGFPQNPLAAGTYDIKITKGGTQGVFAQALNQTFADGQIRTVIILDSPQGGFPLSLLILADKN